MLTIARMTETENAINFPSTCVAYSFWSFSQWEWFSAYYLQQKMKIKKWLWWNPALICQVTFDFEIFKNYVCYSLFLFIITD